MGRACRHIEPVSAVLTIASAAAVGAGLAWADTLVVRPGPCAAQTTYLLAGNSGALIRAENGAANRSSHVIVFRRDHPRGWASRRLLKRFDLKLDDNGGRIFNSGAFCTGAS